MSETLAYSQLRSENIEAGNKFDAQIGELNCNLFTKLILHLKSSAIRRNEKNPFGESICPKPSYQFEIVFEVNRIFDFSGVCRRLLVNNPINAAIDALLIAVTMCP